MKKFKPLHERLKMKTFEARGSSHERGYNGDWRKARRSFLNDHPLCKHCHDKGIITPANTVDHIIPHKGSQALFWDLSNWQALCTSCHNRKTATEDMGAW